MWSKWQQKRYKYRLPGLLQAWPRVKIVFSDQWEQVVDVAVLRIKCP